jgi:YggT family protein
MFIRALLSWFPNGYDTKLYKLLSQLTEPVIEPVRKLIDRTSLANLPIDMSFLISFFVIEFIIRLI